MRGEMCKSERVRGDECGFFAKDQLCHDLKVCTHRVTGRLDSRQNENTIGERVFDRDGDRERVSFRKLVFLFRRDFSRKPPPPPFFEHTGILLNSFSYGVLCERRFLNRVCFFCCHLMRDKRAGIHFHHRVYSSPCSKM